jgi:DNA processing protein
MANNFDPAGNMAVARIRILSARDKIRLADRLGSRSIRGLRRVEAEYMIQRRIDEEAWDPEGWIALAERDAAFLDRTGGSAFSYFDPEYPAILRETARPPFMVYVRGAMPDQERPAVAIVGTRYPTGRGIDVASGLGAQAALAGVQVVSGLARGIDAAAHRGALQGGGTTFAVLGRGIDAVYPSSNKELAMRMVAAGGGLLSEYPPGTPPSRWTFPERNRILAGLCRSTVVVEAPGASGALISASFALDEGRDVYVAAACMGGIRSAGSDALAADGARTPGSFDDIIEDWRGGRGTSAFIPMQGRQRRRRVRSRGRRREGRASHARIHAAGPTSRRA